MIKIKVIPFDLQPDNFENFGVEYMVRVSKSTAKGLAGMYPMPAMSEEICIAIPRLFLANISGRYYVRHGSIPVRDWTKVFKIEVVGTESEEVA